MAEKLSPFDIANNINEKGDLLDVGEVGYDSYVVNKVLSNTHDSVLFANEMNSNWNLPRDMQYAFYYYGISKKKRFGKWHKNQDDKDELAIIKEYYGYSTHKAKEVLNLLRPCLAEMKQELEKGGRNPNGQKRASGKLS